MSVLDYILHVDKYLDLLVQNFGFGIYAILFIVILLETGVVLTPFLPGDSLLFASGAIAAQGSLSIVLLYFLFLSASILGDTMNCGIGHYIGPKVFTRETGWLKKAHLDRARAFYAKYGAKAIVLGRFLPIIRTFVPFVAGIGRMDYKKFLFYNILGGVIWVTLFTLGGYWFGAIPWVQENFSLVILIIILLSLVPVIWEFFAHRKE